MAAVPHEIDPGAAAAELLRRKQARRGLIAFTQYTLRGYEDAPHHHEIAAHLEAIEAGSIDRLIIVEPPRHGKSELASRRFPGFYLGRDPNRAIIASSYNSNLAMDFGRDVRNIVRSPTYQALFPGTSMAQDSKAADRWHTQAGGGYAAVGVGTAATGRDADLFLVDDPLKDREEANSERMRDRLWGWYSSVVQSRLPKAIVVIQTRWHEDDLVGRLLVEMEDGGEQWVVLHHPAISPSGQALWAERYPLARLERVRRAMTPRDWESLFQGRPAPEEGDYFKRDWFQFYDTLPRHLAIYGASDYAVTQAGGDYSVHLVVGVDPHEDIYVMDLCRGQWDALTSVEQAVNCMEMHSPRAWVEEKAQIEKSLGPFITKHMRDRRVHVYREQLPVVGDKEARAQSIRGRAAQRKIWLPKDAPWVPAFLGELLMFPNGKHDDIVDTLGLIGRVLDKMAHGTLPTGTQPAGKTLNQLIAEDDAALRKAAKRGSQGL